MTRSTATKTARKSSARKAAAKTTPKNTAPKTTTKKQPAAKKTWAPLDEARLAFVAENARPAVAPCLCGCGSTTKGRFFPGHDATLKERLKATDSDTARAALATFGW